MTAKRVLIVEDQGIIALDEEQIMRDLGYEVVGIAISGEQAVRIATETKPDVVLMDIKLAGEMDGREAAAKIQQNLNIPVVFVTAYGVTEGPAPLRTIPADGIGYIVKPFTQEGLECEIKRLSQ
ncbi:response regulator [Pseudomonadota bacterium]